MNILLYQQIYVSFYSINYRHIFKPWLFCSQITQQYYLLTRLLDINRGFVDGNRI